MESLETKKKRLKFLKELESRGLESGVGQIKIDNLLKNK